MAPNNGGTAHQPKLFVAMVSKNQSFVQQDHILNTFIIDIDVDFCRGIRPLWNDCSPPSEFPRLKFHIAGVYPYCVRKIELSSSVVTLFHKYWEGHQVDAWIIWRRKLLSGDVIPKKGSYWVTNIIMPYGPYHSSSGSPLEFSGILNLSLRAVRHDRGPLKISGKLISLVYPFSFIFHFRMHLKVSFLHVFPKVFHIHIFLHHRDSNLGLQRLCN
jgi:hypothetical protein